MIEVTERKIKNKRGNRYLLCDVYVCLYVLHVYELCVMCTMHIYMCYMCTFDVYCMLYLSVVQCVCLVNEFYVLCALYMCCV